MATSNNLGTQDLLAIPTSWRETRDVDEPLVQMWQALKLGFDHLHGLLGEFDPGLIGGGHQGDQGMGAFPSHGAGILDHGLERIQQGPIPMMLQNAPAPLNRVVLDS